MKYFVSFQLLESVQGVSEAVSETPQEEPPLPPYPNISDLSITGKFQLFFFTLFAHEHFISNEQNLIMRKTTFHLGYNITQQSIHFCKKG